MKPFSSRLIVVSTAMLAIGLSACATTNETLEQAMSMAREAKSDAASAKEAAMSASRAAQDAARTAAAAQRAAQSAQSAADQANSCCATNSEKIERMFRESMRK